MTSLKILYACEIEIFFNSAYFGEHCMLSAKFLQIQVIQ